MSFCPRNIEQRFSQLETNGSTELFICNALTRYKHHIYSFPLRFRCDPAFGPRVTRPLRAARLASPRLRGFFVPVLHRMTFTLPPLLFESFRLSALLSCSVNGNDHVACSPWTMSRLTVGREDRSRHDEKTPYQYESQHMLHCETLLELLPWFHLPNGNPYSHMRNHVLSEQNTQRPCSLVSIPYA